MSGTAKRVLLVHRHFDPDMTTYAQMLAHFADHLGEAGHHVTVFCGPANYNGVYDGPKPPRREQRANYQVRRVRLPGSTHQLAKLIGFLLFPVAVVLHCWTRRRAYDVVSVTTMPPVVMGAAGALATLRRSSGFVYHCMDLYPELLGTPQSLPRRALARTAQRIDLAVMRRAHQVIVLSEDMRSTVAARSATPIDVAVSNNFIIETHADSLTEPKPDATFRFVFAGNLGRFQGIDRLIDAFGRLEGDNALLFLGAGPMVAAIESAAVTDPRISHHRHLPLREAMDVIVRADAAVVSLEPGVIESAFPSKVLMYLELGRPILALVEPSSELATMVVDERLGAVAAPDDPAAITDAMATLCSASALRGPNEIQEFGRSHFSKPIVLDRWTALYGLGST